MEAADFEKIALFMGWEKDETLGGNLSWWGKYPEGYDTSRGRVETKTSLSDAEAVELIMTLTHKGYSPQLVYDDEGHFQLSFSCWGAVREKPGGYLLVDVAADMWFDTFPEAVSNAVLKLIEKEGNNG